MNLFDLIVIVVVLGAILIGVSSGALPQIGGLLGAFAGATLGVSVLPWLETPLDQVPADIRAIAVLAGLLFIVGIGEALGSGLGRSVAIWLRGGVLGVADRVLGGVVGAAQAVLVVWLVGGLLAAGPMRSIATQAQTSFVVRALSGVLPPPTEIAGALGRLLDTTRIPDLFVGLDPLPAPDVERPTSPAARAIAAAAIDSTFRVSAATCQFTSSGTGFAVASRYVVTNAHVIAGASTVRVRTQSGPALDAVVVFDDPQLDIALLFVADLNARPLRLQRPIRPGERPARRSAFRTAAASRSSRQPCRASTARPAATSMATAASPATSSSCGRLSTRATAAGRSCWPTGPSAGSSSQRPGPTPTWAMR